MARERIVEQLTAAGLIDHIDPHKIMVPRGDRSGAVVEPYLTDQWYVRVGTPRGAGHRRGRIRAGAFRATRIGTKPIFSG